MDLPAKIGKYQLEQFLGGGMSHVYRATDTVLGREVAVKILTESGCADNETKARFLQEAKTAGGFQHDHIISVYDFGEDQGRPFIVMEFLRGRSLRDAIKDRVTGDLRNQMEIALQIAKALQYIHERRIIHRDIKPDNVHVDDKGRVKLMDFGIAKAHNVSLTRVGFTLGTPYYMAPEQVLGKAVTILVDVYSFGILLYELITGIKPVTGDSIDRVFQQILNEPLNLEPLRQKGVPRSVMELIQQCAAKDPAQRIQGFGPLCDQLTRILDEIPPIASPGSTGLNPAAPPIPHGSGVNYPRPIPSSQRPPVGSGINPGYSTNPTNPTNPTPSQRPNQSGVSVPRPKSYTPAQRQENESSLPFIRHLPAKFQTQEWFIVIVALGVILGMSLLVLLLRLVLRLF